MNLQFLPKKLGIFLLLILTTPSHFLFFHKKTYYLGQKNNNI